MTRVRVVAAAVVVALMMAGCSGGGGPTDAAAGAEDHVFVADLGPDTGRLVVLVLDQDQLPVAAARVAVLEVPEAAVLTSEGGRAEFRGLTPATYTVNVTKDGFVDGEEQVVVASSQESQVRFNLAPLGAVGPYTDVDVFEGMMSCTFVLWVTYYMDPADCFGATSEAKNFHTFVPGTDVQSVVAESEWELGSGAAARFMKLALWQDHTEDVIDAEYKYAEVWGESPIQARGDAPFAGIDDGNDAPFVTFFSPPITTDRPLDVGVIIEQPFTIYVSQFYGRMPEDGYTAVWDG